MLVHLNGSLIPAEEASVSVFDRGFLFGDGVYEGLRATRGHIIGLEHHIARLRQGLEETRIEGFDARDLESISRALLDAEGLDSAFIYLQVTRGTPSDGAARPRVPDPATPPTVFAFASPLAPVDELEMPTGKRAALRPDTRWTRGHLKSTSLLGGVLAALEAQEADSEDAIMHRGELVTEGTATNVFAVVGDTIVTPSTGSAPMLHGVTRRLILDAMPEIVERPVSVQEIREAREIMLVGTRTMVAPITMLDGTPVGDGAVGPAARAMHDALVGAILEEARHAAHV